MAFELPDLPYSHDALADLGMSKETLEYHHDLHHKAYVDNGNKLISGTEWDGKSMEDIITGTYDSSSVAQNGIFNNISQLWNHETVESISKRKKPFTVDYTGFGWVAIKHGVFEKLPYPWFAPKMQVFESGAVQDMCGEDVSFCLDAIEEGYEIWCDPRIRVGHEKTRII